MTDEHGSQFARGKEFNLFYAKSKTKKPKSDYPSLDESQEMANHLSSPHFFLTLTPKPLPVAPSKSKSTKSKLVKASKASRISNVKTPQESTISNNMVSVARNYSNSLEDAMIKPKKESGRENDDEVCGYYCLCFKVKRRI